MQKGFLNQLYRIFTGSLIAALLVGLISGCSSEKDDEATRTDTKTTESRILEEDSGSDGSENAEPTTTSDKLRLNEATIDPFSDLGGEDLTVVAISEDKKKVLNAATDGEVLSIKTVVDELNASNSENNDGSLSFSEDDLEFNDAVLSTDKNMIAAGVSSGASPDTSSYTVLFDNSEVYTRLLTWPARPISFSPNGRRLVARVFISGCKFDNAVFEISAGRKLAVISDRDCGKISNILGWISDEELKYEVVVKKTGARSLWKFDIRSSKSMSIQEEN